MRIYDEYPKMMRHPAERTPPVVRSRAAFHRNVAGAFPAVSVNGPDQEMEYRAQGYRVMGEAPEGFVYQEYPKWVNGQVARNEQEEAAILSKPVGRIERRDSPEGDSEEVSGEISPLRSSQGFDEASVLKVVRDLRSSGVAWASVSKTLNDMKKLTKRGKEWTEKNVRQWCMPRGIV
jgi:hypothetical protein